jgi:RNA polymerase sigma factor (sigma-70 family)
MPSAQTNPILRLIGRMVASRGPGDAPDRQLLERFVHQADESAFQTLVQKYGALVLSVCTRVLRSEHDVEDAFQATFLVFVRKAGSIRTPELLGPWLYGVAYRTALKAKAAALKRRRLEKPLVEIASPPVADDLSWRDLRRVLDEEVNRLPLKYRMPFVLCYFEGKTNEQAAEMLGCPQGTVFSRLAWARDHLRRQLSRRGLAPSVAALAALLSQGTASAAVPTSLVDFTSRAALAFAAGGPAPAGTISPPAALAEGVLRAMFLTRLKIAVVVLLAVAVAGAAAAVLTRQVKTPASAVADKPKTDKDHLQGSWIPVSVEDGGKKVPEKEVKAKDFTMVFAGDKMTIPIKDEAKEVGYKLDPSKNPKQIDLLLGKGKTAKGIYLLQKDTLKLCVQTDQDGERPGKFSAPSGTTHFLIVLKKKK